MSTASPTAASWSPPSRPTVPRPRPACRPQDVITSVDGKPIKNGDELVGIISDKQPGSTVHLGILRSGKPHTPMSASPIATKLFAEHRRQRRDDPPVRMQADVGQNKLGITVQPVTPAVASHLGIKGGVTVTSVRPGSFADEINLPTNVIIIEINRHPVTDEASYRAVVSALKPGDDVVFVVRDPQGQNPGDT